MPYYSNNEEPDDPNSYGNYSDDDEYVEHGLSCDPGQKTQTWYVQLYLSSLEPTMIVFLAYLSCPDLTSGYILLN